MKLRWVLAAALAVVLAGCAGSPKVDVNDETVSLVFGYFDMKDAPSDLEWVSLKQYGGASKGSYSMGAKDGLFWHIGVEPGSYQVDRFGGTGGIPLLTRRPFEYDFGSRGRNGTAIRIPKAGVYFVGAHKFVTHSGNGFFQADKFEMKQASTPGEKELLRRLIKELESDSDLAKYTRQIKLAKQRLGQL